MVTNWTSTAPLLRITIPLAMKIHCSRRIYTSAALLVLLPIALFILALLYSFFSFFDSLLFSYWQAKIFSGGIKIIKMTPAPGVHRSMPVSPSVVPSSLPTQWCQLRCVMDSRRMKQPQKLQQCRFQLLVKRLPFLGLLPVFVVCLILSFVVVILLFLVLTTVPRSY